MSLPICAPSSGIRGGRASSSIGCAFERTFPLPISAAAGTMLSFSSIRNIMSACSKSDPFLMLAQRLRHFSSFLLIHPIPTSLQKRLPFDRTLRQLELNLKFRMDYLCLLHIICVFMSMLQKRTSKARERSTMTSVRRRKMS